MSWFDLNPENIGYSGMAAATDGGQAISGIAAVSFSTLDWRIYCASIVLIIILIYCLVSVIRRVELNFGSYWKFAVVLSAVAGIYAAFFIMLLWDEPFGLIAEKMREGTFGDSFGTLNTLFSGLAFSGVLITMLFQRKDLFETRSQIAHQQIESQFYSMLGLQQEVVKNFDLQERDGLEVVSRGRDCFKHWAGWIPHFYEEAVGSHEERIADSVSSLIDKHKADLGLYFRSLYSVFRFIYGCNHVDRAQFGLVVRSLLSDHELVVLFYNSLSSRGEKFKKYIYEFALFDNLEVDLLVDVGDINMFDFQAYGSNRNILEMLIRSPSIR
ncbi:putative phage abortive infection protein [Pseudomonas monsensis]